MNFSTNRKRNIDFWLRSFLFDMEGKQLDNKCNDDSKGCRRQIDMVKSLNIDDYEVKEGKLKANL